MAMDKQRKTFLSYSRVNKDFAIRLAQELKAEGFELWLDQLDIEPGAWWDDEVERALEECEIFMVIITPSSSASKNVKDEIGYALDNQKRILPVLLENATLPLRLRRLQYVDFTTKNFDDGVNAAKDLLRKLMAQPTLPRIELSEEEKQQLAQADAERRLKEEAERFAAEKAEQERIAQQQDEEERAAKAKAEEERLAKQKAEEKQLASARAEREAKAEAERKAKAESKRRAKEEAERLAAQKAEEQRLAKQRQEAAFAATAEADRLAKQKAEDERIAAQTAEEQRLAKQKADEELTAKARSDSQARAEAELAAKEEAERLSRTQIEQESLGSTEVQSEPVAVPVKAEAARESAPAPAMTRKPVAKGLMYGAAAFVLVCGGIGFGIFSSLNKQSPSSPSNPVVNTAVKSPTDVPDRVANPTNTSIPIPEWTAVPSRTPVPTASRYFTEQFDQDPKWNYFLTNGDEKKLTSTFSNGLMIFELQDLSIYVYFIYEQEEYTDVRIDMRAENRGKNNNNVSLVCRASKAGWYEFSTEGGGVWYLYKATVREDNLLKTVYTTIGNGGAVSLKQGKEVNDYAMICQDNELTLIVNGQELATVRDPNNTFPSGNVGFNISSLNVTPIIVDVDWFKISEP